MMQFSLVVVRPFAEHRIGDVITDAAEISRVLGSELAGHVVRVTVREG